MARSHYLYAYPGNVLRHRHCCNLFTILALHLLCYSAGVHLTQQQRQEVIKRLAAEQGYYRERLALGNSVEDIRRQLTLIPSINGGVGVRIRISRSRCLRSLRRGFGSLRYEG